MPEKKKIDEQFTTSLNQIRTDDDVLDWIVSVMGESTAENKRQRAVQVAAIDQQKRRLEDRLDKMYLDKLDGVIGEEEYARLSKKFKGDLTDTKFKMEQLKGGNEEFIDSGKRLLELAQKATSLYSAQIPAEKRKLLNSVYSNSTWAGEKLSVNFNKPLDMIAVSNVAYQREKATFPEKNDLLNIWRPLPDLNRCRRRERAVSWARLDEGDV